MFPRALILLPCLLAVSSASLASTPCTLSNVFGDAMVLQRDDDTTMVWGFAEPGTTALLNGELGAKTPWYRVRLDLEVLLHERYYLREITQQHPPPPYPHFKGRDSCCVGITDLDWWCGLRMRPGAKRLAAGTLWPVFNPVAFHPACKDQQTCKYSGRGRHHHQAQQACPVVLISYLSVYL